MEVSSKANGPSSREQRAERRSKRILLRVPVVIKGIHEGDPLEEITDTVVVNEHGCLIGMKAPLFKGQHVRIVNPKTKEEVPCAVVFFGKINAEGKTEVGLAFNVPSLRFWQIVFPPIGWNPHDQERLPSGGDVP